MMVQAQEEMGEADEAVNEEMDDSLVRAATTATGLDAEQDSGNINKTQSKATPNEPSSLGTSSGGGPRRQETMGDTIAQTGFENVSKTSIDSLLARVGKSARVISSDEASLGDQEDASKQGRKIDDIDKDAEITLVDETQGRYGDEEMFDTGVLDGDEVLAEPKVIVKDVNLSVDEVTLAQALAALKSAKVQEKANVVEEPCQKLEEDKESKELKQCLEIIPNDRDDVTIDATPLSTKSPTIVDYKIYKEGKKSYLNYQSRWRIVGIKRLHDDLEVTAAKLMLLVYKLLLLVLKVNAASTKATTAQRLRLLKEFLLSEKG
ncbi:hypothetical protein Tco_0542187 [Tanacetum coccineum]